MLEWILATAAIGGFSAAALELLRESNEREGLSLEIQADPPLAWNTTHPSGTFSWEQMSDSDLDRLVAEFSTEPDRLQPCNPN